PRNGVLAQHRPPGTRSGPGARRAHATPYRCAHVATPVAARSLAPGVERGARPARARAARRGAQRSPAVDHVAAAVLVSHPGDRGLLGDPQLAPVADSVG